MPQYVLRINVKGVEQVIRNLSIAQDVIRRAVGDALQAEGELILEEAKNQCPTETGALRNSAFITPPVQDPKEIRVICGFGTDAVVNPKTDTPTKQYAVPVHERLDVDHPTGKAKFLEDPAHAASSRLGERVASRVSRLVGR